MSVDMMSEVPRHLPQKELTMAKMQWVNFLAIKNDKLIYLI